MRFHPGPTTTSWSFLWFPALLLAFAVTGCDSAPNTDTPEVKKQIAERQEQLKKTDEEANALNKKATRGKGAVMKNIKAGLKTGP